MICDVGKVWVCDCTGLSGFCRALVGRALPLHPFSLADALFLGRVMLQMLQAFSAGLFSSYVQLEQVHVVMGGFASCCRIRRFIFIATAVFLRLCFPA